METNTEDAARVTALPALMDENNITEEAPQAVRPKKKKKLSKAERKALRLKRAQEFKKFELRQHLERELELSRRSARKGHETWENMCKEIKIVELRQELQEWETKAQRLLQQKDDTILLLLDDIETTQEMHKRNYSKQLEVMDYIIESYRALVETSKTLYETQATELLEEYFDELSAKNDFEETLKENCENVMHATNIVLEEQLKKEYQKYLSKQDERVNSEIEKRYRLRDAIAQRMKDLHKQLLNFVQILQNSSLDVHKYERINMLMERQRNFVVESQKLNDTELRSSTLQVDLQRELLHIELEAQRKLTDLRLEHGYFVQVRKDIENNMNLDREITFAKLRTLTSESYKVKKQYQKLEKYGDLLLSLAANCRKLETEAEKVVPNGEFLDLQEFTTDDEEILKIKALDLKAIIDLPEEELAEQMKLMKNFWRRQAIVETQNLLLQAEKRKLKTENQTYVNIIKSLSKSDDINELLKLLEIKCVLPEQTTCGTIVKKCRK